MDNCISCGMPMRGAGDHAPGKPDSSWCLHCSDEAGNLQKFEERFERMVQWQMKKKGEARPQAEASTRAYMAAMPAWKDEPRLKKTTD